MEYIVDDMLLHLSVRGPIDGRLATHNDFVHFLPYHQRTYLAIQPLVRHALSETGQGYHIVPCLYVRVTIEGRLAHRGKIILIG